MHVTACCPSQRKENCYLSIPLIGVVTPIYFTNAYSSLLSVTQSHLTYKRREGRGKHYIWSSSRTRIKLKRPDCLGQELSGRPPCNILSMRILSCIHPCLSSQYPSGEFASPSKSPHFTTASLMLFLLKIWLKISGNFCTHFMSLETKGILASFLKLPTTQKEWSWKPPRQIRDPSPITIAADF